MSIIKKCKNCGKWGIFLKLEDGLCNVCSFKLSEEEFERLKIQYTFDNIGIDKDVFNLLWFYNGSHKNTEVKETVVQISEHVTRTDYEYEPSMIDLELPVVQPPFDYADSQPHYFPKYAHLNAYERYNYIQFLKNPYSGKHNISYVFLFFYGLERHLCEGQYLKALSMIIKLRKIYNNKSFLQYSSRTLIYSLILKKDRKLIEENYNGMIEYADLNALCALSVICKKPLSAENIFKYRKDFYFRLETYTKLYVDLFISKIKEYLIQTYGVDYLDLNQFIAKEPSYAICRIYANMSLKENPVPLIMNENFFVEGFKILNYAHDAVKTHLRKTKEYVNPPEKPAPDYEKLYSEYLDVVEYIDNNQHCFDKVSKSEIEGRHRYLCWRAADIYKYREHPLVFQEIIKTCYEDINLVKTYKTELEGNFYSDCFFKLIMIYEKQKEYSKIVEICDVAISAKISKANDYTYYEWKKAVCLKKLKANLQTPTPLLPDKS